MYLIHNSKNLTTGSERMTVLLHILSMMMAIAVSSYKWSEIAKYLCGLISLFIKVSQLLIASCPWEAKDTSEGQLTDFLWLISVWFHFVLPSIIKGEYTDLKQLESALVCAFHEDSYFALCLVCIWCPSHDHLTLNGAACSVILPPCFICPGSVIPKVFLGSVPHLDV